MRRTIYLQLRLKLMITLWMLEVKFKAKNTYKVSMKWQGAKWLLKEATLSSEGNPLLAKGDYICT